jgi:transcriptional regulator with XRE-family HTH domain
VATLEVDAMPARRASPTVRRRRLGAELRRCREAAGLTIEVVADRLEFSTSKVSRLETGQTGASPRDVRDMLTLYQVATRELEALVALARAARQKGWWQPFGGVLTGAYVAFEAAASMILSYEAQCVPGLLQVEEYARALLAAVRRELSEEEREDRVRVRMARQTLLTQDDPIDFRVVLDEGVLARSIGGAEVMRKQLDHLVAVAALPNVTVQVLPLSLGAHSGMEGSFSILRYPDDADPDVVYVAMATGGVFQEKSDELSRYSMVFDHLREAALPPAESAQFISTMAKEPS